MRVCQRCLRVVAELFVELVVLFGRDVLLGARPDRVGLVHCFPVAGFHHGAGLTAAFFVTRVNEFAVFPLFLFHQDRQADVIRVLGDDALEFPGAGVIHGVIAQVQDDAGAALGPADGFDLEVTSAAADPAYALVGLQPGAAGFNGDLVGNNKAGVKAHAKLANQLALFRHVGLLVAGQAGHEVLGTALGDGAQVIDGLLLAHADAVVRNRQRFGVLVKGHAYFQIGRIFIKRAVVERLKAQFVAGVGCVGDQLAQENLFI